MRIYYADSSVMVKRHVIESGSSWFRDLVDEKHGNVIVSSHISIVEVCSAFSRRVRETDQTQVEFRRIMAEFDHVCATEYKIVPVSVSVVELAKKLLSSHPLRAYDSIQLASAIFVGDRFAGIQNVDFTFLAADNRLLDAADAEGLQILNPSAA